MAEFSGLDCLRKILNDNVNTAFDTTLNGNLKKWLAAFDQLPEVAPSLIDLTCSTPVIGQAEDLADPEKFKKLLREFIPWRKGPFEVFGTHIDTEWRSDFKWDRLKNHLSALKDRLVLDIGCGNGYHCLRMIGEGAKLVIGVDPNMLSVMQFKVLKKYFVSNNPADFFPVDLFPLGVEGLPDNIEAFDTVLTMGVIYHRKDPLEHLRRIKSFLKPGGEIVLETLVVDGDKNHFLVPKERYAQMRNVWQIPSVLCAEKWLRETGFCEVRTVDVTTTTTEEQRGTGWMLFHSLPQFLDPNDKSKTIEGYPAPKTCYSIGEKELTTDDTDEHRKFFI